MNLDLLKIQLRPDVLAWFIPVVGVVAAVLAYLLGRRLLRLSRGNAPPADSPPSLADSLDGVSRDRRAAPRRAGNHIEVQILLSGTEQPARRGWILDRSIGGIGLLTEEPFEPGQLLRVRPREAPNTTPWTDVSVRTCRPYDSQHEVGCQFIGTPNWNQLLHFG